MDPYVSGLQTGWLVHITDDRGSLMIFNTQPRRRRLDVMKRYGCSLRSIAIFTTLSCFTLRGATPDKPSLTGGPMVLWKCVEAIRFCVC